MCIFFAFIIYLFFGSILFLLPLWMIWADTYVSVAEVRRRKKIAARLTFLLPVWPIIVLFVIVRRIVKLFKKIWNLAELDDFIKKE